ncbi:MAG TPA: DUF4231 domain-containing protein [Candidatus Baltobacteraceae bacterium]|nr:DUF4231 domain-containing protein [Candidatus Baltobacteraceae bacterium]
MLTDSDLPPLYDAADKSSSAAQKQFLWAIRIRLFGLIAAAFFGLFVWKSQSSPVDWAGVLAILCFAVVIFTEASLYLVKPERTWYEARAAAESVKTLSWRFAVGGAPFNVGVDTEAHVSDLFLDRLKSVLGVLKNLDLIAPVSAEHQITPQMRILRASAFADRKSAYEHDRVANQQIWYQAKANWNRRRAFGWNLAIVVAELLGVSCAVLKTIGVTQRDLLTFSGVIVATMVGWLQAKQHRTLATAYTITALELASVRSKIADQNDETEWAEFVNDAEEAFSREHTLWKASRGIR